MTEETLFNEALPKPAAERAAFLDAACAGQPQLRAAVEALLAAHERSGNVLDNPPVALGETVDSEPGPARPLVTGDYTPEPDLAPPHLLTTTDYRPNAGPGLVISGRYTLHEKIGEGGMGEVWVAKQTEPVKRKVALKLIKAGMDTKAVLQRFEAERQALAMMDHPSIARVLDGGMTADRRPFFVMELVNGLPLTKYCDEAKLGIRERLELFAVLCQAVQHAHQKGIIHRDLKPSNIMVTLIDARPVPKVIDFGVAKAIGGKLLDESLSTQLGAVVGTLEYMAPEQAGYSGTDIDTRADIYSLGVILYELLTGLRPIDAKRLKKAAYAQMIRIIQEEEPSKPSTRLSTDESLPSLAALRHIEPKKLMALLRGELDWVVMKCLEKQRERRYETANGLARDIQRYLADEPVEARPPAAGYRLHKFLKRNKGPVIAASLVLFALLAGMIGTTWGLIEARRQEQIARDEASEKEKARQAEAEQRSVAEAQREKAEEEKTIAQAVRDFLQNKLLAQTDTATQADALLKAGESSSGAKLNPTIRELLDRAAKELAPNKIEESFPKQPLIQAEILQTIGNTYRGIGQYQPAINFLKRSGALYRQHRGPEGPDTLGSMNSLAVAYRVAGKLDLALPLFEETLKLRKATLGPEHPDTLTSMNELAVAYHDAGKLDQALPLAEEALKLQKATLGPEHPDTLTSMNNLAVAYLAAGKLDLALPLFDETLKLRKATLGTEHPNTLGSMNNLAWAYQSAGKLDLALPLYEETLKLSKAKLGPEHPDTLTSMNSLAWAYQASGKVDLALPLHEETLKLSKATLGPEHPDTLTSMNKLAVAYQRAGKLDLALPLFEETLKLRKAKLGPEHPDTLISMNSLAMAYPAAGKLDLALPLFEETLKLRKAKSGPEHPETLICMNNLAWAYQAAGKLDLALPLFEETLKLSKATLGPEHPDTVIGMDNLASAYRDAGKVDLALPLCEETLKLSKATLGPEHPDTLISMSNLARAYQVAGKLDLALPLFEETLKLSKAKLGPEHPDTLKFMGYRASAYDEVKQFDKAELLFRERLRLEKQKSGGDSPAYAGALAPLGLNLLHQKKWSDAEPFLRQSLAIRAKAEPDVWSTFDTKSMLGGALLGQKEYADAEPLLLAGYEGMKKREARIPAQGKIRLTEALERLVQLYEATNKKGAAAEWRKELDAIKAAQRQTEKQP